MNAIELKKGNWVAKILPHFGMNLISLTCCGKELLRTPADFEALQKSPRLHGFPLILPANRTADGVFSFEGRQYSLAVTELARNNNNHGFFADAPYEILSQSETELTARFCNRGERYPFSFDILMTDTLTEEGFTRRMTLQAKENMPFTVGFHATFAEPKEFSVPLKKQYIRDDRFLPTGETIDPEPLPETFDTFFLSGGTRATLDEFAFTVSENFDHWVLFNADGKQGFLCIEPQCGLVNGLNIEGGHHVLKKGEEETFSFTLSRR